MFGFAKIISLQIVVREPTTFEMHFGEYGWRPLRNWRRLVEDKLRLVEIEDGSLLLAGVARDPPRSVAAADAVS